MASRKFHLVNGRNQNDRPYNVILRDKTGKILAKISFIAHYKKQDKISDLLFNSVKEEFIVSDLKIEK